MSAEPPAPSEPGPDDPIGVRYPNTARIWNYQLGGKDNFAVDRKATDEAHPEAAEGLFRMTQELHWNTPLISRSRAGIARFFDGFTLVEPGLVAPAQWRPDLDEPLLDRGGRVGGGDVPVLRLPVAERPEGNRGVGWHLCGVGIKDRS